MHPGFDALVRHVDGEPSLEIGAHLRGCPACRAELARVSLLRQALRELPLARPPRDGWPALASAARSYARRRRLAPLAAAAALVLVVLAGVIAAGRTASVAPAELASLQQRSAELERALRLLEPERRVVSAREASAAIELEDLLASVDARLAGGDGGLELWQQRVGLLDALVEVRATRAKYTAL